MSYCTNYFVILYVNISRWSMKGNSMLKKIVLVMMFVMVSLSPVMAQVAADPNDSFYEDALRWELQGLIPNLPEMRPYSLQLVKSIL